MKIGLGLASRPSLVCGARLSVSRPDVPRCAEAGPFSSLSVFDRLIYAKYEPLVTLAAVAGEARRVRLVTSVRLSPLRTPTMLAKMIASLDALSNGRLSQPETERALLRCGRSAMHTFLASPYLSCERKR